MESLLLSLASELTVPRLFEATRWNALLWSIADLGVCIVVLDVAERCRAKKAWIRRMVVAATGVASLGIFLVSTPRELFALEAFICGTQFLVILGTIIYESRIFIDFYHRHLR